MAKRIVRRPHSDSIPVADLRRMFNYDPESGILTRRVATGLYGKYRVGSEVGHIRKANGYVTIGFQGAMCTGHRLIWAWMTGEWPSHPVDHINGVRSDNRWANLRAVTPQINSQNMRRAMTRNKLGVLGVSEHAGSPGVYIARIRHNGATRYIGTFRSVEDAHQAYLAAKRRLHEGCTL